MKQITKLTLTLLFLLLLFNCKSNKGSEKLNYELTQNNNIASKTQLKTEPRIIYVIYGSFCGECWNNCTKLYRHDLIGNITTFWTDETDSYFEKDKMEFNTKMNKESEKISYEFINKIPVSILKSTKTRNIYGCPDCTDGCGLYFEYQLDEINSKPIIYEMDYSLADTDGDVKDLGVMIKQTIEKLNNHR